MAKFREHITPAGTLILAGKSAKNNESLITQAMPDEDVFHTRAKGSPFVNIKGEPQEGDIEEAAIMCARYSQDWRDNHKNVVVHQFKGKDISKRKDMQDGTFGVKSIKNIKVLKTDIEKWKKSEISS